MSINGYIIEKYNNMANAYTCSRLVSEAGLAGIDLKILGVHDTMIGNDRIMNGGAPVEKRRFVINRYKWGKTKDSICGLAEKSYNKLELLHVFINKYEQVSRLRSNAFIIPQYLLGTSLSSYESIAEILGERFVAKGLESSMGEEVLLIQNPKEMKMLASKYGSGKEWLFEEFITTSIGHDIRFYSIRGEVIACMQRKSQGDFRANVALGADVEPYEITSEIKEAARDVYGQTGLDFLGIDLLFGKDKPYFCEINVMPGLEGIERASGVNIARRIIKTISGDFENE